MEKINGFVKNIRVKSKFIFIIITNREHIELQLIVYSSNEVAMSIAGKVSIGSYISCLGKIVENPSVKLNGKEFIVDSIEIISHSDTIPIDNLSSLDTRMDYR
jgi:aspartyl/asparaginyl-tRNA synthetase